MNSPLRVLHLEDEPDFSTLVTALLEREGLQAEVSLVSDFTKYRAALEENSMDIILSDFLLPSGNGRQALELARLTCPEVPFVLLSGAIGEQAAIDIVRRGATDYVLKSQLDLLVPAIQRALQLTEDRRRRRVAETEARRSEAQYRLIFEGSPVPMWVSDLQTSAFLEVNEAAIRHYGYSREEFLRLTTKDICSEDEVARLAAYLADAAHRRHEEGRRPADLWRHRRKDGTFIDVEITWSVIQFNNHEALLTMANDVTELRQAVEALKKSEASLAAAQRIAGLGSWEMDLLDLKNLDGNPLRCSEETCRILGREAEAAPVAAGVFFDAVHPEDRREFHEVVSRAVRNQEPFEAEVRVVQPGGAERAVRERAEFAPDSQGNPSQMRGIVMDITERKVLEEQLRQSQKLEAIGQLAGGVAHDFNNILTVTHGHAVMLLGEKNLSKTGKESAQQIAQAAERAAGLTRALLAFSRRQVMQLQPLDLNDLVRDMSAMLGRILGEDIVLQLTYPSQPAWTEADAGMMEQVLLNLALNARDAMPKGGQLAIEISHQETHPDQASSHREARTGKFVRLSVSDDGVGISPAHLPRIFEPFFTTKETGNRIGFGLATAYGIVKQHQGWIEAESDPGHGATFRVYLPARAATEEPASRKSSRKPARGGDETILYVEDEPPVRHLVTNALTAYGYKVLSVASGSKALDVWRRNKGKISLLLTDIVLPDGLNGRELAEKLRKQRPQLKVIFSSGYSADVLGKDFVLQRGQQFVQKPYDLHKLALTVRAILDRTR